MSLILNTLLVYNCSLLALKGIYTKIEDKTKNDIIKNGLYHITSEENADKIIECRTY